MNVPKILALALLALPLAPLAQAAEARIVVTGEGSVAAPPDLATISLGVTSEAATAADAMAQNSGSLARVLERLRAAGIEPRDIQTSGLSLNPNWEGETQGERKIGGYVASNQLTVRVRKLDGLGAVLDSAVSDGANTLNGVTFGLSDPEPALAEARRQAVAKAEAKARLLADAAGVTLGRVLEIGESGGYQPPMPVYRMDAAAAPVPMAAGEIETSAQVTLIYEITQ